MRSTEIQILSLAQLTKGQDWQLTLAHDRDVHLLLWITRGQGRLLLDGQRRGVSAHNVVMIPAGRLFALDMGRQSLGHAVIIPVDTPLRLPEIPRHLRIRDIHAQTDLTALIEAATREQQQDHPLRHDALEAHSALISVWLRRQILLEEHVPEKRKAAAKLAAKFCVLVSENYKNGTPMADYAAHLDVTPTHLSRAVKASTGRTAAELLTERTLHAARSLLASTNHPAQAIARYLGFGSAAYFTRFIQQHTGLPPSKLRAPDNRAGSSATAGKK